MMESYVARCRALKNTHRLKWQQLKAADTITWMLAVAELVEKLDEAGLFCDVYPADVIKVFMRYYVELSVQGSDPESEPDDQTLKTTGRKAAFPTMDSLFSNPTQFRYIAVLGGTGTGKTSLLVNYY